MRPADLDTPLSLYLKLAHKPFSFLLESVVGGERFGRYSFIGLPATTLLRSTADGAEVLKNGQVIERYQGNPLDFVDAYQKRFKVAVRPGLPRFCGGLAGYFAYDTVRYIEPRLAGVAPDRPHEAGAADQDRVVEADRGAPGADPGVGDHRRWHEHPQRGSGK